MLAYKSTYETGYFTWHTVPPTNTVQVHTAVRFWRVHLIARKNDVVLGLLFRGLLAVYNSMIQRNDHIVYLQSAMETPHAPKTKKCGSENLKKTARHFFQEQSTAARESERTKPSILYFLPSFKTRKTSENSLERDGKKGHKSLDTSTCTGKKITPTNIRPTMEALQTFESKPVY